MVPSGRRTGEARSKKRNGSPLRSGGQERAEHLGDVRVAEKLRAGAAEEPGPGRCIHPAQEPPAAREHMPARVGEADPGIRRDPRLQAIEGLLHGPRVQHVARPQDQGEPRHFKAALTQILTDATRKIPCQILQALLRGLPQTCREPPLHEQRQPDADGDHERPHRQREALTQTGTTQHAADRARTYAPPPSERDRRRQAAPVHLRLERALAAGPHGICLGYMSNIFESID